MFWPRLHPLTVSGRLRKEAKMVSSGGFCREKGAWRSKSCASGRGRLLIPKSGYSASEGPAPPVPAVAAQKRPLLYGGCEFPFEAYIMSVDAATVRRIAQLARIAVTEAEVPHLQG